jgi:hypothetical protein
MRFAAGKKGGAHRFFTVAGLGAGAVGEGRVVYDNARFRKQVFGGSIASAVVRKGLAAATPLAAPHLPTFLHQQRNG